MEFKKFFEEGDRVLLCKEEQEFLPYLYPIGTIKLLNVQDQSKYKFYIEWESGEESIPFNSLGQFNDKRNTTMLDSVMNYGNDEKSILIERLKLK
jgi:hypothetical protein